MTKTILQTVSEKIVAASLSFVLSLISLMFSNVSFLGIVIAGISIFSIFVIYEKYIRASEKYFFPLTLYEEVWIDIIIIATFISWLALNDLGSFAVHIILAPILVGYYLTKLIFRSVFIIRKEHKEKILQGTMYYVVYWIMFAISAGILFDSSILVYRNVIPIKGDFPLSSKNISLILSISLKTLTFFEWFIVIAVYFVIIAFAISRRLNLPLGNVLKPLSSILAYRILPASFVVFFVSSLLSLVFINIEVSTIKEQVKIFEISSAINKSFLVVYNRLDMPVKVECNISSNESLWKYYWIPENSRCIVPAEYCKEEIYIFVQDLRLPISYRKMSFRIENLDVFLNDSSRWCKKL